MSGFIGSNPIYASPTYNPSFYTGSITYIDNVIQGTATASKALVVDSSLNIVGINSIGTTSIIIGGNTLGSTESAYLTSITAGTAIASKALVVDSSKNLTAINNITSTGVISNSFVNNTGTIIAYQTWQNAVATPINIGMSMSNTGTRFGTTSNHNFRLISNNGVAIYIESSNNVAIGAATPTSGFKFDVQGTALIQTSLAMSALANKAILRTSTISSSGGLEIYDTQTASSPPIFNFKTGNNSAPIFFRMCSYLNDNTTMVANGMPFDISQDLSVGYTSGLRISATNTTQASNSNYNISLSARNGTIPHVVVNDSKNQLHLFPVDATELNTAYVQNVICGSPMFIRKYLCIGDSQDTSRLLSMLDSTQAVGTSRYMTLGHDSSNNNQAEISFYYAGSGSSSNRIDFGLYGSAWMFLTAQGRLGIQTNAPSCPLDVAAVNNVQTTISIGVNTLTYNIATNTWSNLGGGPYTASNIAIRSRGNIWCQDSLFATSDRRLKENIESVDFDLEHFSKLRVVSYKFINTERTKLGLIAQEVVPICREAVEFQPNDNMKAEMSDDPEGMQLTLDYNCISMMSVVAIQKLLDRICTLEDIIKKLLARLVVLESTV